MIFKHDSLRDEYHSLPTALQLICGDFETLSRFFGIEPIVTRVREEIAGSSGVHEAGRAVDFRDEFSGVVTYREDVRNAIVEAMNAKYSRHDGKPTCYSHSFQGGPRHFHVQLASELGAYRKGIAWKS